MNFMSNFARVLLVTLTVLSVASAVQAGPPSQAELRARKLAARRYAGLAISLPESAFANGLHVCARDVPSGMVGYWKVPAKIVDAMDVELLVHMRKSGLGQKLPFSPKLYLRQYAGFVKDGQRFVYVNALLVDKKSPLAEQAKKSYPSGCAGGGVDGYWGIQYDTQAKQFTGFSSH